MYFFSPEEIEVLPEEVGSSPHNMRGVRRTTLLASSTPRPNCAEHSPNQAELGRPTTVEKSSASLFAVLNEPVKAMGGVHSDIAILMKDNGTTENFIMHALAEKLSLAKTQTNVITTAIGEEYKCQETYESC